MTYSLRARSEAVLIPPLSFRPCVSIPTASFWMLYSQIRVSSWCFPTRPPSSGNHRILFGIHSVLSLYALIIFPVPTLWLFSFPTLLLPSYLDLIDLFGEGVILLLKLLDLIFHLGHHGGALV